MIEHIYPYLILCGCTIGVVLWYLWRQALAVNRLNLALIAANDEAEHDALRFLGVSWSILSQAQLRGMQWQLTWYGVPTSGQRGTCQGNYIAHQIQAPEMHVDIKLYTSKRRGEQGYFVETVIATFLLLLRTDMLIKSTTTTSTFMHMAKLNLFLQHDIKNIAQFIQLMTDQLEHMADNQAKLVLDNLRSVAPLVRQRADRIVQTLTVGQDQIQTIETVSLREQAQKIAQIFLLPTHIIGDATVFMPVRNLDCALENIIKNYYDDSLREGRSKPTIEVLIMQQVDAVEMRIFARDVQAPRDLQFERLFEPFWSSDPHGTGIGLYQAKQILESCGASLQAHINPAGSLEFLLRLPHKLHHG